MAIHYSILNNLIYSFNNVIPVFIIILIGFFLKKSILTQQFSQVSNKVVFNIALPAMIFSSIYTADLKSIFDFKIVLFCMSGTIILFLCMTVGAHIFINEKRSIGSFVQGSFRSNFVIIGIPLIKNLADTLGQDAVAKSAIIILFMMPLYNILAVIILSISSSEKKFVTPVKIIRDIFKNPLIISVIAALPFSVFNISTPAFFSKSVNYLAAIAVPLALIDIGYNINFNYISRTLRLALISTTIKIVLSPLIFTTAAYLLNFRQTDLSVIYILFASPTAISSYIMAKGMNNNADLAGSIVLITTLGSMVTIFIGVFILSTLGFITTP